MMSTHKVYTDNAQLHVTKAKLAAAVSYASGQEGVLGAAYALTHVDKLQPSFRTWPDSYFVH